MMHGQTQIKDKDVLRAAFDSADSLVLPAMRYLVTLKQLQDDKKG